MTEFQDIDLSRFVPQEVDNTGITVASTDRFTSRNKTRPAATHSGEEEEEGGGGGYLSPALRFVVQILTSASPSAEEQLNGACGGAEANGLSGAEGGGEEEEDDEEEEVPVDENLFTGEDLEELDEELNTLALEE